MFGMYIRCSNCIKKDVCKYKDLYKEIFELYEKMTEEVDRNIEIEVSKELGLPMCYKTKIFTPESKLHCDYFIKDEKN